MPFKKKEGYGMSNDKIQVFAEELDKEFNKRLNNRKNKKFILSKGIISGVMITIIAFLAACGGNSNNANKKETTKNPETTTSLVDLSDLGKELKSKKDTKSKGNNTTGYVGSTGKVYVDEESAKNASKVGNSTVDTKGGKLTVYPNGKVFEQEIGYEIKDEKGNVTDKGNLNGSGIPSHYAWDSVLGKYVKESEVGKYVYCDATYYDDNGNIAIKKGDIVSKETLANAKKYFSTTKPSQKQEETQVETQPETQAPTTSNTTTSNSSSSTINSSSNSDQGVVNADGTYTIDGMTYLSQADYQQCIIDGFEGYAVINGVVQPEENVKQYQYTK